VSIGHAFVAELEHEAANTRRVLALVPADKADFKPHDKSFALGPLAVHITEMHRWMTDVTQTTGLDFAAGEYNPAPFSTTEELLARFDRYVAEGKAALASTSDEAMGETWTLSASSHVIFAMPRVTCLRSMVFNHIIHHRAQMTVYLRLLDIPVPGLYGPSADE
jgi:uncharacterized damage-inducible protein DinB